MKNHIFVAICILSLVHVTITLANEEMENKKALIETIKIERVKVSEKNAFYTQEILACMKVMNKIVLDLGESKNGQTIGEMMNPAQAGKYGEIYQKYKYLVGGSYCLNRRIRDLDVFENLLFIASNEFEWNKVVDESYSDERVSTIFNIVDNSLALKMSELKDVPYVNDDIERKLAAVMKGTLANIVKDDLHTKYLKFINDYQARTGQSQVKIELLSAEEKEAYEEISTQVAKYKKFSDRIFVLRSIYAAMTLDNQMLMDEIAINGGDIKSVGKKTREVIEKWNETSKHVMNLVWFININYEPKLTKEMEVVLENALIRNTPSP